MNIERRRGDTRADSFTVTLSHKRGIPANITGANFKMTLNSIPDPKDDSTQVYQLTGDITDPEKGVVEFSPAPSQADRIGYFYFDIQMTDTYGKVHTLITGTYTYCQDITK